MAKIVIYTIRPCNFSRDALELLDGLKVAYENVDLTDDPAARAKLIARSGRKTFPQVFVDDKLIGGYTQLADQIDGGEFQKLVGLV